MEKLDKQKEQSGEKVLLLVESYDELDDTYSLQIKDKDPNGNLAPIPGVFSSDADASSETKENPYLNHFFFARSSNQLPIGQSIWAELNQTEDSFLVITKFKLAS